MTGGKDDERPVSVQSEGEGWHLLRRPSPRRRASLSDKALWARRCLVSAEGPTSVSKHRGDLSASVAPPAQRRRGCVRARSPHRRGLVSLHWLRLIESAALAETVGGGGGGGGPASGAASAPALCSVCTGMQTAFQRAQEVKQTHVLNIKPPERHLDQLALPRLGAGVTRGRLGEIRRIGDCGRRRLCPRQSSFRSVFPEHFQMWLGL